MIANVGEITLGLDVGTNLGFLYESLGVSNDGNIEGVFLGGSLLYTDGNLFG